MFSSIFDIEGILGWIVAAAVSVVYVVSFILRIRVDKRASKADNRVSNAEKRDSEDRAHKAGVEEGILENKVDNLSKSFEDFRNNFKTEMHTIVSVQLLEIALLGTGGLSVLLKKTSPQSLTSEGTKVSKEIGAKDIAQSIAPILSKRVQNLSEYEIQKICLEYIVNEFKPTDNIKAKMNDSAYRSGVGELAVKLVIAIELRDALLNSRDLKEPACVSGGQVRLKSIRAVSDFRRQSVEGRLTPTTSKKMTWSTKYTMWPPSNQKN